MLRFKSESVGSLYSRLTGQKPVVTACPSDALGQLILNVAAICNMRCSYCFAGQGTYGAKTSPFMAAERAIEYVDNLLGMFREIEQIKFFGGEPLLNVDCIEAVCAHVVTQWQDERLKHLPHFHVNTNLTVAVDRLARLAEDFGVTVTVGIDGPPEVHDTLRFFEGGRGSFSVVDENIRRLIAVCDQPRSLEVVYTAEHKRRGLRPVTIHQYLTERYGPRNIIIHPEVPILDFSKRRTPRPRKGRLSKRSVRKLFVEYGQFLGEEALRSGQPLHEHPLMSDLCAPACADYYCDAGVGQLAINTVGDIYPCACLCGNTTFWMGHAVEGGVDWERFSMIRRRLAENRKSRSPTCASCAIVKTCSSCPAAMLRENGALNAPVADVCAFRMGVTEGRLLAVNQAQGDVACSQFRRGRHARQHE